MSDHCKDLIEDAKLKERSYLPLNDWQKNKHAENDFCKDLFLNCEEKIERRNCEDLTLEEFVEIYEKGNKPLVIKNITKKFFKESQWTYEEIYKKYKNKAFKIAEDSDGRRIKVPLKYFLEYIIHQNDDYPLYLFGSVYKSDKNPNCLLNDMEIPNYFQDDILNIIDEKQRPPFRWFLLGPKRSGSKVHIDPFKTSAWNTCLMGFKRWIMFPENFSKGLIKGKEYTTKEEENEPLNYFLNILPKIKENIKDPSQIIEFIQNPGETVFIPGGWWHAVVNLEDSIAYTQNFMSHASFDKIWKCLRVDRLPLAVKLLGLLKTQEPDLYKQALALNKEDNFVMDEKDEDDENDENLREVHVFHEFDNMKLLDELIEIEKIRKFSDTSDLDDSDRDVLGQN